MNTTIYGRGQMVIPAKARKQAGIGTGDVVSVEPEGDGRLVLVRLERPNPRQHQIHLLRRKGRHSILTGGPTVAMEQVRASLSACHEISFGREFSDCGDSGFAYAT